MTVVYYVLAGVLILVGIAGTVLPALPGLPLVFVGMLVAAWAGGFQQVGWLMLTVLGLLTVLSIGIDVLATAMGAKRVGASRLAVAGRFPGPVAGWFFGPAGLSAGPFAGALGGELIHARELGRATKVGFATWLGIIAGIVLKLGLAFTMLGLFALAWWF